MNEHRLIQWEPSFRKYIRDFDEGEWSPAYLQREGVYKPELAENHYECTCGDAFGTDEQAAETHVEQYTTGEQ